MKLLKYLLLFFIFFTAPQLAFGQSIADDFGNGFQVGGVTVNPSFKPSYSDLSVSYLGQIFGDVGDFLHGTSGQMLGHIFKVFNIGMLVLAGIFLIYTIFMTVLNTAHEGEFMGRKWNSAWIAIRTVMGLGLLVPSATSGYSTIQVFVMWVVIQGVGFANMAWNSALQYIGEGGQMYTPPSTDVGEMINLAGTIMQMQVCMYTAQTVEKNQMQNLQQSQSQSLQAQAASSTNTAAPIMPQQSYVQNFKPLFTSYKNIEGRWSAVVRFPGNKYQNDGDQDNACGQIGFGTSKTKDGLANDQKITTLKAAVQQMMLDTDRYAQEIANPTSTDSNNDNFSNQVQGAIVAASADWINITLPIRTSGTDLSKVMTDMYIQAAVESGWIMAGRYYYALGSIQRKVTDAASVFVIVDAPPPGYPYGNAYISFSSPPTDSSPPQVSNMKGNLNPDPGLNQPALQDFSDNDKQNLRTSERTVALNANNASAIANQQNQANKVKLNLGSAGILGFLIDPINSFLLQLVGKFSNAVGDPIIVLQGIGDGFLTLSSTLWLMGTIGIFALGTGTSTLSSVQPVGYGVEDAVIAFVPTFTAFILIFATLGATFSFYVPLIPFIIYAFAAIGWLVGVIEAMVAAPLVALGITHPEGHDLLGKSEQAIMLLLSVFLRPVLMVIGLVAGMILSRVVLRFINAGFFGVVFDVGDFNVFAFAAVLVVYAMLLVTIVNQAFSLIYLIPDRVMRWLGVSEQTTQPQEALQSAKGGFEQVSGAHEKLGGGITSSAGPWKQKQLERKERYDAANVKKGETTAAPKNE